MIHLSDITYASAQLSNQRPQIPTNANNIINSIQLGGSNAQVGSLGLYNWSIKGLREHQSARG